jgi:hypothetical protein
MGRNQWGGVTPWAERSQVTTHICCVLGRPDRCRCLCRQWQWHSFIPDVQVVIGSKQVKSHHPWRIILLLINLLF